MHVLFFTYDVPYPANSGGKTRALNLLKSAKSGVTYSLFSFTRPGFNLSNVDELKKIGIKTIELFPRKPVKSIESIRAVASGSKSIFSSLYYDPSIEQTLHTYLSEKKVDILHFESFYTGFYLSPRISAMGIKQVFGTENIEYKVYEEMVSQKNFFLRPVIKREVEKTRREEISMAKNADVILAVTETEASYFQRVSGKKCVVIENGVSLSDFPKVSPQPHDKLRLLFIGNFSYYPNVDALSHFCRDVFARMEANYELIVVGQGATQLNFLKRTSVQTIEYVADIYDAYAMTDVFISPIRIGGGTNFKVLEAMAAGLPVVAYRQKTSGVGFVNGRDILQVENTEEFIQALALLRKDMKKRKMLGYHARELVAKKFEWKEIGKKLNIVWKNLHETN